MQSQIASGRRDVSKIVVFQKELIELVLVVGFGWGWRK
jgi:hypothetical protein